MIVAFFGHRDTPEEIEPVLKSTLIRLIEQGADHFYVGNHGNFDRLVRKILQQTQKDYPQISYWIVLSTMPNQRIGEELSAHPTVVADGIEETHPKYRIVACNRWMIEKADVIITFVKYSGGAAQFKALAERKGKTVIELSER